MKLKNKEKQKLRSLQRADQNLDVLIQVDFANQETQGRVVKPPSVI